MSDLFGKKGLAWLKEEPKLLDPDGWLLGEDVELADALKEKIRATEGLMRTSPPGTKRSDSSRPYRVWGSSSRY